MEDEKGGDAKLIAVVATEPRTLSITDIEHVPSHIKAEIQQFFELYKALEAAPGKPKWVKIRSLPPPSPPFPATCRSDTAVTMPPLQAD